MSEGRPASSNLPEVAKSRRRWFAFRLRTMFVVVTLFAAWLGWNVSIVNARRALRQSALKDASFIRPIRSLQVAPAKTPELSIWRKWLGDEPTEVLRLQTKTYATRAN